MEFSRIVGVSFQHLRLDIRWNLELTTIVPQILEPPFSFIFPLLGTIRCNFKMVSGQNPLTVPMEYTTK